MQHIAVWNTRMAMSPRQIVAEYPHLSVADVEAALAYYHAHRDEIEADLREEEEFVQDLQGGQPSIAEHLRKTDAGNDSLASG